MPPMAGCKAIWVHPSIGNLLRGRSYSGVRLDTSDLWQSERAKDGLGEAVGPIFCRAQVASMLRN